MSQRFRFGARRGLTLFLVAYVGAIFLLAGLTLSYKAAGAPVIAKRVAPDMIHPARNVR